MFLSEEEVNTGKGGVKSLMSMDEVMYNLEWYDSSVLIRNVIVEPSVMSVKGGYRSRILLK